eukprot:CAMPEP_0117694782 /NCGR_PEP_ID=MMETSP0804-20121206/27687_1 /TAXON_ID=1074897 /ORGANISM="Tetraselmis astigmatica, Strain CCMP880" /LENGTH=63 /DNA_ID=CAMNT_0005508605 /DNA_START=338 /DNA_END=526 /DNA_ORIENTATION=-
MEELLPWNHPCVPISQLQHLLGRPWDPDAIPPEQDLCSWKDKLLGQVEEALPADLNLNVTAAP